MSLHSFIFGVEFAATSVASPDLSGLREAISTLPSDDRAKYYAGFLDVPPWTEEGSLGQTNGHITASPSLQPLLDKVRPNAEARAEFVRRANAVEILRPSEGICQREPSQTEP